MPLLSLKWEQKVRFEIARATSHCFFMNPMSFCVQMGLQGHQEAETGEPFRAAWPVTLSLLLNDTLFSPHNRARGPRWPGSCLPAPLLGGSDLLPRFSALTRRDNIVKTLLLLCAYWQHCLLLDRWGLLDPLSRGVWNGAG